MHDLSDYQIDPFRGFPAGVVIGSVAGLPFLATAWAYSALHAPAWPIFVAAAWTPLSGFVLLRRVHRRVQAEGDRLRAALARKHAEEVRRLEEWRAELVKEGLIR